MTYGLLLLTICSILSLLVLESPIPQRARSSCPLPRKLAGYQEIITNIFWQVLTATRPPCLPPFWEFDNFIPICFLQEQSREAPRYRHRLAGPLSWTYLVHLLDCLHHPTTAELVAGWMPRDAALPLRVDMPDW
ncbi:hypothetical protein V8F20_007423 [Naviculisporaceae sp. PSN 640]